MNNKISKLPNILDLKDIKIILECAKLRFINKNKDDPFFKFEISFFNNFEILLNNSEEVLKMEDIQFLLSNGGKELCKLFAKYKNRLEDINYFEVDELVLKYAKAIEETKSSFNTTKLNVPKCYKDIKMIELYFDEDVLQYARINLPELDLWNEYELQSLSCDVATYLMLVSGCSLEWNKLDIYDCIAYMLDNNLDFDKLGLSDSVSCGVDNPIVANYFTKKFEYDKRGTL